MLARHGQGYLFAPSGLVSKGEHSIIVLAHGLKLCFPLLPLREGWDEGMYPKECMGQ
jgi:hypothetical protein